MGWAEGQGLGRENKGIVKHIWTKKRNDQVGLGGEVGNDWGAHSIQTNTYNSLLSKLAVITNNSDSDSDTDSGSDSEPAAKASASKRKKQGQTGKKKGRASDCGASSEEESDKTKKLGKKKSKKAKREASSDSDSSDEDLSKAASASCDDYGGAKGRGGRSYAAAAAKEAKEKKEAAKVSTSSLRYAYKRSQMNRTKDVKSYSATDLSQMLGFSVAPKEEDKSLLARDGVKKHARAGSASSADSSSDSDNDSDADETRNKRKQENKGAAEGKAERKKGIVIGSQARKPMVLPPPTVLTGVLSHMFCNGGFLSGEPQKQKEQDWQFDEATQEKIAVDAHENKAAGKKGLGFSSDRPSKLGKDYKGSKKRFDDEDEDEEAVGSNKVDRESDWGSKQKLSTSSGDEEEEENKEERKRRRKAEKKAKKAAEAAAAVDVEVEVEESEEERKKRRKAEKKAKRKAAAEQEESEMNGKKKKKKKQ